MFFWFVLLSALGLGPAGAVLYRMAEFVSRHWLAMRQRELTEVNDHLPDMARHLFALIDNVPARLTAAGFAVVGNFEEAVNAWRRESSAATDRNEGVILAAASGAVGVRMGSAAMAAPVGLGEEAAGDVGVVAQAPQLASPQSGHLQSMVGLVWRSVVLWMLLVALLTLANVVG